MSIKTKFSEVDELAVALNNDKKLLSYVIRRFLSNNSIEQVAVELGLKSDAFDLLFAEHEDIETKFIDELRAISEKRLMLASSAAAEKAMKELDNYFDTADVEDVKATVSACTAVLNYHARQFPLAKKIKGEDEDDIDRLYKQMKRN